MESPQVLSCVSADIDFKPPEQNIPYRSYPRPSPNCVFLAPRGGFVTIVSYVGWDAGPELCGRRIKIRWPNNSHSFGFYIYLCKCVQGEERTWPVLPDNC